MKLFTILQIMGGGVKSTINSILSEYGIPIVAVVILLTAIIGAINNMELIMDKDGRGTRKEGLMNVVYIVLAVAVVIAVIGAVLAMTNSINLSI